METKMKNNSYRRIMVKRGMGMMAAAVLSAMLLAGCGQNGQDTERARDTVSGLSDGISYLLGMS